MAEFFSNVDQIRYSGPDSDDPLSYRWYDKDRVVGDKTLAEHLRLAVCYWHSFNWPGNDVFGDGTFDRPWLDPSLDPMAAARSKMAAAFEFVEKLDVPFFSFHDHDMCPYEGTFEDETAILHTLTDEAMGYMDRTGIKLLWGTARLFHHPRYMAGAATNPDPEVFARAAAQVANCLDVTHKMGGANYVLWGGREGYETLLNTDLSREMDQFGRFLSMVVEHKYKIGFEGALLIEPKPQEPTKHQYDWDAATTLGFLDHYGLTGEFKLNIECNHATLSGHSCEHELLLSSLRGALGNIDANTGDAQTGWDTDQFLTDPKEATLLAAVILKQGGLSPGGINFDAKLRRESTDLMDLFYAHISGMDALARGLRNAAEMIADGTADGMVKARYASYSETAIGKRISEGKATFEELEKFALANPDPVEAGLQSGRAELHEVVLSRFIK